MNCVRKPGGMEVTLGHRERLRSALLPRSSSLVTPNQAIIESARRTSELHFHGLHLSQRLEGGHHKSHGDPLASLSQPPPPAVRKCQDPRSHRGEMKRRPQKSSPKSRGKMCSVGFKALVLTCGEGIYLPSPATGKVGPPARKLPITVVQ